MCHFCKSTPIFPILSIFSSLGFKLWFKNTNIYLKEKRGVIMLSAFFTYLPANVMVLFGTKTVKSYFKDFWNFTLQYISNRQKIKSCFNLFGIACNFYLHNFFLCKKHSVYRDENSKHSKKKRIWETKISIEKKRNEHMDFFYVLIYTE